MRTSFEIAARKVLQNDMSRLIAQKQLGLDQAKTSAVIDHSLEGIITELRKVSTDEFKARKLHSEIARADTSYSVYFPADNKRSSSLEPAGKQLLSLIGADGKTRLSEALIKDHNVTQSQADDALGFVTPVVVDSLKTSLSDGSFANNVTGLNEALKTTGRSGASVSTTAAANATVPAASNTANNAANSATVTTTTAGSTANTAAAGSAGTATAQVAGSGAVAASKPSWLMRFGLPFLLLGALLLGAVKYCGDAGKSKVVADERDQLQQNLAGAQEQNEKTSGELASLQTDYVESQSKVESLEGELQTVQTEFQGLTTEHDQLKEEFVAAQDEVELNTAEINVLRDELGASSAEIEKLRDLPQDALGLQEQLVGTMQERDDAVASEAAVIEQLKSVEANRDQTQDRNESLQFDIDNAQKSISSNSTLLSEFRSQVDELEGQKDNMDAELKTASQLLEEEKAKVDQLTTQVSDLEDRVAEMTGASEQVDAEIASLEEQRKELESSLQETQATLDNERDGRQSDNSNFTTQAASLQNQLATLTSQSDTSEAALAAREDEITQQAATISELQQQVETLEVAKAEAADSKKLLDEQVAELEQESGEALKLIEARDNTLAERASELDAATNELSAAQEELKSLQAERDELLASVDELKVQAESLTTDKDSAISEVASKDLKNTELADELQSLQAQSGEEIADLNQVNAELSEELTEAMALNTNLQRNVDLLGKKNDELEKAGVVFEQSLASSEQEIDALAVARDKLQSEVAATGSVIKAIEGDTYRAREAIAEKLAAAGYEDVQVKSIDNNRAVAITLGSNILFRAGDVAMSREGAKVLHEVGKAISDYPDWRIDVEGHTDSLPIGKRLSVLYPSNWELSSARASAVINRLRFANGIEAASMSARGFADTQPVAENSSAQGRGKNRRVDIVLRR